MLVLVLVFLFLLVLVLVFLLVLVLVIVLEDDTASVSGGLPLLDNSRARLAERGPGNFDLTHDGGARARRERGLILLGILQGSGTG